MGIARVVLQREEPPRRLRRVTFRVSLHWQAPEKGRESTKADARIRKRKSMAAQDFAGKVASLLEFLKTAVKTPCLPAIRRRRALNSCAATARCLAEARRAKADLQGSHPPIDWTPIGRPRDRRYLPSCWAISACAEQAEGSSYIRRSGGDPSRHYVGITSDVDKGLHWHSNGRSATPSRIVPDR
jgi:hypothetical protein